MPNSEENEDIGDNVPLVSMMERDTLSSENAYKKKVKKHIIIGCIIHYTPPLWTPCHLI